MGRYAVIATTARLALSVLLCAALAPAGAAGQEPGLGLAPAGARPGLLETGVPRGASTPGAPARAAAAPAEVKVVSYNIRYPGVDDLEALVDALRSDREIGGAQIVGLQEIDRDKRRTGNVNTARAIAEALGMHYAWAGQPPRGPDDEEEETGIALLSAFPLADVERVVLPHAGPGGRRRVALAATVLAPPKPLRVVVVHSERRLPLEARMEQLETVLRAVERGPHADRVVVLGDLNTYRITGETVALFTKAGYATPVPHDVPTLKVFMFATKLDWIWVRGLDAARGGVASHLDLSDHRPVWATVKL